MNARHSRVIVSNRQRRVRIGVEAVRRLVRFVAAAEGIRIALIDVVVVDAETIASMNARYLRHAGPTDVLSFDLSGGEEDAGDSTDAARGGLSAQIVVCGPVAAEQGPLHGNTPRRELMLYIVHGLLHLTGHDDTHPRAAARMHAREEELLRQFEGS